MLFGPPGVGKGTQGELIEKKFNCSRISTGDIFRENIRNQTELGIEAKSYIDKGELVPDSVTLGMVENAIVEVAKNNSIIILDGFPRNVNQAEVLDDICEKYHYVLKCVIALNADDNVIIQRLSDRLTCKKCGTTFHKIYNKPSKEGVCDKCGGELYQRSDDTPHAIANRLDTYRSTTEPVLNYYQHSGKLAEIDASASPEDISKTVFKLFSS